MSRYLERYPNFADKENLLRAAVRYKHYSLVEYFLEEQVAVMQKGSVWRGVDCVILPPHMMIYDNRCCFLPRFSVFNSMNAGHNRYLL